MKIINKTKNTVVAQTAQTARNFLSRLIGLLNRTSLSPDEALLIFHCKSIHMFFMRFSIDVIFVDKNNIVVGLVEKIRPFRLSPIFFSAHYAIELCEGAVARTKTSLGDQLVLDNH